MADKVEFAEVFRAEHRAIRDALLGLIQAFRKSDPAQMREFLGRVAALAGPHFRYEEEALYPALTAVLDEEQVGELVRAHDSAIEAARELKALAARAELGQEEAERGARLARNLLPHVFECDGLSIMAELLPEQAIETVLKVRAGSLGDNLDLLRWADTVRPRSSANALN